MKLKPWVGITAGLVAVVVSWILFAQADITRSVARTQASFEWNLTGVGEYTLKSRATDAVASQWQTAAMITLICGLVVLVASVGVAIRHRRLAQAGPAPATAPASASAPDGVGGSGLSCDRRPCPRCGESLARLARVCRFCDHTLPA